MKFKFKLYDNEKFAELPSYNIAWSNFHITKHLIINAKIEFFYELLHIEMENIKSIREIQINKYNCKVSSDYNPTQPCLKCNFKKQCSQLLSPISKKYYSLIAHSVQEDYKNPRNVMYQIKTENKKNIVFVTDKGLNIIAKVDLENNIKIVTCYRIGLSGLNDFQLKLHKLYQDDSWQLHASIKKWNDKLRINRYKNIRYYLEENWMWV